MKKRILSALMAGLILISPLSVNAEEEPDLHLMNCTAYCVGKTTATGDDVEEGICATSPDHVGGGWIAVVYQAIPDGEGGYKIGDYLWTLECKDRGKKGGSVEKGYTLDVYRETYDRCQDVMDKVYENGAKGKVFVQFVKGEG